jgi:hypothetical protein
MAIKDKLIKEINSVLAPKLFNIKNKTATEREKSVVQECLGFLSLINHSSLSINEIKKLWDKSNLKFQ